MIFGCRGLGTPTGILNSTIISEVFRGRVICFLLHKIFNLTGFIEFLRLFIGFLIKNTHWLGQNSQILCFFVTTLFQMIKLSELYQLVCLSSQAN